MSDGELVIRHVIIRGRVQGIGYRAWVERTAAGRGLQGWVRNCRDGAVEAVFAGTPDAVAAMVEADSETAWRALLDVDLLKLGREAPLVGMLGALRMLPELVGHLLHGERPAKPPESMRLRDLPSIPMRA